MRAVVYKKPFEVAVENVDDAGNPYEEDIEYEKINNSSCHSPSDFLPISPEKSLDTDDGEKNLQFFP